MSDSQDIWSIISTASTLEKTERIVIIVGEPNSGKSTIATLLSGLKPSTDKKPPYIIDYTYGKIPTTSGIKRILHIYEIGECNDTTMILDSIVTKQLHNFLVIVTADLAEPGKTFDKISKTLNDLELYLSKYEKRYFIK